MADTHSDYNRGEMEIKAQRGTFDGFMAGTIYGGAHLVVILLFPILVFAANVAWFPALIATLVVGIIMGIALKLRGAYYVVLIAAAILTAIICGLFSIFM